MVAMVKQRVAAWLLAAQVAAVAAYAVSEPPAPQPRAPVRVHLDPVRGLGLGPALSPAAGALPVEGAPASSPPAARTSRAAASEQGHYGDPALGCRGDEVEVDVEGVGGRFCSSVCDFFTPCPSDVPDGFTAVPQCALADTSTGTKYCALMCGSNFGHCGGNASCKTLSPMIRQLDVGTRSLPTPARGRPT